MADSQPQGTPTTTDLIAEGSAALSDAGIDAARFEANIILSHILEAKPSRVTLESHALTPDTVARFRELVRERADRVPLQYVIGTHDFMGLTLSCRPGVFVPRPETELLAETAIETLTLRSDWLSVADLGCGSGAIAVALAHHLPAATVHAVDVSSDAAQLAAENARRLHLADRIRVYQGDLLAPLVAADVADGLDAIVANLPYIPTGDIDGLQPEVRDYEPRAALDGGSDGLTCFRELMRQIADLPPRERFVALEVGLGQAGAVEEMLEDSLDCSETHIRRDYAGIERIVSAVLDAAHGPATPHGAPQSCTTKGS